MALPSAPAAAGRQLTVPEHLPAAALERGHQRAHARRILVELTELDATLERVLVTRNRNRGAADGGNVARQNEEARLMSVKTRKTK